MIELGKQDDLKLLCYFKFLESKMHNRISFNQLAGWINLDESLDSSIEQTEIVNDYFNCLIECDDDQASCKRYCKTILM